MQCLLCKEEASIKCCEKEFCSSCVGTHMMQVITTKHRPIQIVENGNRNLIVHIQTCLNNELLELEEFRNYCLQVISSFNSSLQNQVNKVCQDYQNLVLAKCQEFENSLKKSLSHLILQQNNTVLEFFKDCQTAEDIKKVKILQKSINCDVGILEDLLNDSISFCLDFNLSEASFLPDHINDGKNLADSSNQSYSNIVKWHQFPVAFQPIIYNFIPASNRIEFCGIHEQSLSELQIDGESFPKMAAWNTSQDGKLILTGGFEEVPKRESFVFSIFEKKTEKFPKMSTGRYNHAQLEAGCYIYVIGGSNGSPLRDCERFNLHRKEWTAFSKLVVARECPAACYFQGIIYVFGGNGIESIECCNISKPEFKLINVRMPGPGRCCVFVHDFDIFVLQKGKIFQFLYKEVKLLTKGNYYDEDVWSSCEPVVRYMRIAWASGGKILLFSLGDFSLSTLGSGN